MLNDLERTIIVSGRTLLVRRVKLIVTQDFALFVRQNLAQRRQAELFSGNNLF